MTIWLQILCIGLYYMVIRSQKNLVLK